MSLLLNEFQTPLNDEFFSDMPQETIDQFWDYVNNIPFIQRLISSDRKRARDLERDSKDRIIVDLANPHILEDMDYFRETAIHYNRYGVYTFLRPNGNPNSEYGKWIRREIDRSINGMVRESDGEWIPGTLYWFLNYCVMQVTEVTEGSNKADRVDGFPEVWEGIYWRFHYRDQARNGGLYDKLGGKNCAELASRGKGKAHPYSQHVYTPEGLKMWGDIKIGDYLFGDDGRKTKVVDIPFNDKEKVYKITLADGRIIYSSLNHEFKVKDNRKKNITSILTLNEILNSDYKHIRKNKLFEYYFSIQNNNCVEFNSQHVNIDPYTLGLLLGDGCFRTKYINTVMFTSGDEDIDTYTKYVPYNIRKLSGKCNYRIDIDNIKQYLKEYGLYFKYSKEKFIPQDYLINSKNIRFELLKGLMDSDGTVNNNGIPMITTSSKQLCDDIMLLCRSLGFNVRMFKKQSAYKNNNNENIKCAIGYNISILTNEKVFKLERKNSKLTTFKTAYSRSRKDWTRIVDIEYSHDEMCKCVTVDNDSHCYLIGDFVVTHNSFSLAAILSKSFILGDDEKARNNVKALVTAYQKEYLTKDGVLNKFLDMIDFCADHTQFPRRRLKNSFQEMNWVMGYKDSDLCIDRGTKNSVLGVSSKDDESKLRGKRSANILIEEFGAFPRLIDLYNILIPSVKEGKYSFGQIYALGTAGDSESDFSGAQEIMYNPNGYYMYALPNVFDKVNQGRKHFVFFFPGYINRKGTYNKDGVSDVTQALKEILLDRYNIKNNSSDPNTILKSIAEIPITPAEAIIKTGVNIFPVTYLNERLLQIDSNPRTFDTTYVGELVIGNSGNVDFRISDGDPIRTFPHKDNKVNGAIEIHKMPEKDKDGKVFSDRYILGADTYDDDSSETMSLGSIFVLDMWTDEIVAEYTGRPLFADDFYETCRRLCLFYNGRLNYENNKKGLFAYFSRCNSLYLLTDILDFLKDKDMVKGYTIGNKTKGTQASLPVNNYGRGLLRSWLLKPTMISVKEDDEVKEVQVANLYKIKNRALIQELISFNSAGNFDRISAMLMLMLLREDKMILYGGDLQKQSKVDKKNYAGNDAFFSRYDKLNEECSKFSKKLF